VFLVYLPFTSTHWLTCGAVRFIPVKWFENEIAHHSPFFLPRPKRLQYLQTVHIAGLPEDAMQRRLENQLGQEAQRLREEAFKAETPREREGLLRRARQAETAAHIDEWASSPGLRPPS
jgi:hypothetical protein